MQSVDHRDVLRSPAGYPLVAQMLLSGLRWATIEQ